MEFNPGERVTLSPGSHFYEKQCRGQLGNIAMELKEEIIEGWYNIQWDDGELLSYPRGHIILINEDNERALTCLLPMDKYY
jgi:hypothetical protein